MSDSVTPWIVACQAPLSMGFSQQEYWSGLPCPSPGDLPHPGIKPVSLVSPALASVFFTTSATWEAHMNFILQTRKLGSSPSAQLLRLHLPMQRVWVQSLVKELRSHKPCGEAREKKKNSIKTIQIKKLWHKEVKLTRGCIARKRQKQDLNNLALCYSIHSSIQTLAN